MNIILDALKMTVKAEAHAYLKEALNLPDYYGKNLDALYDCLTELPDMKVVVENADLAAGTYFDMVMDVFRDVPSVDITMTQAIWDGESYAVAAGDGETGTGGILAKTAAKINASGKSGRTGSFEDAAEPEDVPVSAPGENFERLVRCMERAAEGGELTIGFIGGSITQGARASEDAKSYAFKCYEWWITNFPQAVFRYVNGGIGGTCSYFGVARAEQDLLRYQPDVVVVDFSVNDVGDRGEIPETVPETYEGLIRKILNCASEPAVVALYNVFYDTGETVEPVHRPICEHYGIPGAGIKETVYQRLQAGEFEQRDITPDGLHPNDEGHAMVAEEICKIFERAKDKAVSLHNAKGNMPENRENQVKPLLWNVSEQVTWELPEPFTRNRFEDAVLWNISNAQPRLNGFRADASEKMGHLDCFKNGWIGKKKGDKITFLMQCESLAVQYRKTIQLPSPVARLTIDGDMEHAVILDGNFEQDWGDCLYLQRIFSNKPAKARMIEIEIIEASENDRNPFYLLSLITA